MSIQVIEVQNPKNIDAISGASNSGSNFIKLATAVINQAIEGDAATIVVK